MGEDQSPERLKKEADAIGYPVLIKAVAGGGGKGMRKVDRPEDFEDSLESCKREAASSFGNDVVLLEKWIESPRHIEVQVFGDSHGNVVHLFERDCSLQRRHQKVIEEAPAPGMDAETREAVCGAAVRAAQAVNYEGAGTIEFIADASEGLRADRIWFMEMNTRLQVEHPVTEEITGQDLVEWQLRVASGENLPKTQDELAISGHAIEARLYAEDPAKGFLPSVGRLDHLELPEHSDWQRIETGVTERDAVSPFYDPMIAKIIVTGQNRAEACDRLTFTLDDVGVWPVKTNAAFLYRLSTMPEFLAGDVDTGLIERRADELTAPPSPDLARLSWWVQLLVPPTDHFGFRLNASQKRSSYFLVDGDPAEIEIFGPGNNMVKDHQAFVAWEGRTARLTNWRADAGGRSHGLHDGEIEAPMPGKVTAVEVKKGEKVAKGQRLLTLEAMKMEHALTAPFDGTVAELNAEAGAQVTEGKMLVRIEANNSTPAKAGAEDTA
jgi:3-methylcrotonyl-CoA carboxylase alpha subunit